MDKTLTLEQLLKPGVIETIIEASYWRATPVSEQAHIELLRWQVSPAASAISSAGT